MPLSNQYKATQTTIRKQRKKSPPTCVYVRVFLHVRLLVESLSAILTRVGARVTVDQQVSGQGGRALETLPALLALGERDGEIRALFH
jgi:hypothetical protein